MLIAHCAHCGIEFWPRRKDARYCGLACRVGAHRARRARAGAEAAGAGRKAGPRSRTPSHPLSNDPGPQDPLREGVGEP